MTRTEQAALTLSEARQAVPLLTEWKHYKGGTYRVIGHCLDTDNGEARVRYDRVAGPDFNKALEADIEFVRPVSDWTPERFTQITR